MVPTILVHFKLFASLSDTELEGLLSETKVFGRDVTIKEDVDAFSDGGRQCDHTVNSRSTIENTDEVGEIIKNRQIVLDDDDVVIRTEQAANDAPSSETLLNIEEGTNRELAC
jgi:hypothetical protein